MTRCSANGPTGGNKNETLFLPSLSHALTVHQIVRENVVLMARRCHHEGSLLLPRPASSAPSVLRFGPSCPAAEAAAGKSVTEERALKAHSEAERRRRERINAHLSTLRHMIPEAKQMDKAALLARVVDQVRELKRRTSEAGEKIRIPKEVNEVTVELYDADADDQILHIKASVCCDDRPDLFPGLTKAFHGLGLRTIRADMASMGGRVQCVFILSSREDKESVCLSSLQNTVKETLARVASPEMACSSNGFSNKRKRLLESHYFSSVSL